MTDNHKHDKLNGDSLREAKPETSANPELVQSRLSLSETINKIQKSNTNRHSGSAGSADGSTVEIDMGGGTSVSRLNPLSEKELIAAKPEARKSERMERVEKAAAPEGCSISMSDFFDRYISPLADAYHRSKCLPLGSEGKSTALESVVDRMKSLPWYGQLKVQIDTGTGNSRYDNEHNTLHIQRRSNKFLEVQEAGHESYHASHQLLSKLYDCGKVSQSEFVRAYMHDEAESFVTEIKIRHELSGQHTSAVEFVARGPKNERMPINLERSYANGGVAGLLEVLRNHQPFEQGQRNYVDLYSGYYAAYALNFDKNLPYVKKYLDTWVAAGHKRDQL